MYIFVAWAGLYLGSFTILGMWGRVPPKQALDGVECSLELKPIIWVFSIIGLIGLVAQSFEVAREFGGLSLGLFAQANDLYHARVDNPDLLGMSYVGAFSFASCPLAGLYTAKIGKVTATSVVPLVLVTLAGMLAMGRAGMIFAGIWFVAALFHTPGPSLKIRRWQAGIGVALVAAIIVGGFALISSTRGLSEDFSGLSPTMEWASDYFPTLPSLYFDYTGPVAGFSDYLAHPDRNSRAFTGMYTFAPIFRFVSRLGARISIPYYDEYYYTPRAINVMTYLQNIHSDFGGVGVLIFPYFLGALMTWLTLKLKEKFEPVHVVLLAHGYLIISFSFAYNPMLTGLWYISLALGVAACYWSKRRILVTSPRALASSS